MRSLECDYQYRNNEYDPENQKYAAIDQPNFRWQFQNVPSNCTPNINENSKNCKQTELLVISVAVSFPTIITQDGNG